MEEDILNYLPTVMFRGTPCILTPQKKAEHYNFYSKVNLRKSFFVDNVYCAPRFYPIP